MERIKRLYDRGQSFVTSSEMGMYYYFVAISCLFAVLNVLFSFNEIAAYILIAVEGAFLTFALAKGHVTGFLCHYLIIVSNCIEFDVFAGGTFYGLKNLRIAGFNLAGWILLPMVALIFIRRIPFKQIKEKNPTLFWGCFLLLAINAVAFVMGVILGIVDDNGVRGLAGYFRLFIGQIYSYLFIPVTLMCAVAWIVSFEKNEAWKIKYAMYATLIGAVAQMVISLLSGVTGAYGANTTTLCSVICMYVPFLLLFSLNEKERALRIQLFVLSLVGTGLLVLTNASGKAILVAAIVILVYYLHLVRKNWKWIVPGVAGMVAAVVAVSIIAEQNPQLAQKVSEVVSLFTFSLEGISYSPRIRIEEYICVFLEYMSKPWLMLTGKGYMGTIVDMTGFFQVVQNNLTVFSQVEWDNGTFFAMHEYAGRLLQYGLLGVGYTGLLLWNTIKQYKYNKWLLLGTFWFVLYYGYSFTISVFGMAALLLGLYLADEGHAMKD